MSNKQNLHKTLTSQSTFCHNFFLKSCNKKRKYPKNILIYLLEKYPDKDWHWGYCGISYNPNITLELIEKYPDKDWYWGQLGISSNPNLTLELIEKYPDKNWYWGNIVYHLIQILH